MLRRDGVIVRKAENLLANEKSGGVGVGVETLHEKAPLVAIAI